MRAWLLTASLDVLDPTPTTLLVSELVTLDRREVSPLQYISASDSYPVGRRIHCTEFS